MFSKRLTPTIVSGLRSSPYSTSSVKMTSKPYIATHDGTFHCDDVTACFMLKQLDRFKNHDIVRTRDQEKLDKADIVVDVGSVLDVQLLRLDHHQRTFNQTILDYHPKMKITNSAKPTRLSSSGLVYAIFGRDVISKLLHLEKAYQELDQDHKRMIDAIYEKSYLEFFEEIDAIDNGVEVVSGEGVVYNYHINSGISSRVGRLNPMKSDATPEQRLEQFKKAMDMVGSEISEGVQFLGSCWWPARQNYKELVLRRKDFHPSGKIVLMENAEIVGWKSAFFDLEEELGIQGELNYFIYTDGDNWRILAVPIDAKSFVCRTPLLEEWRGKRDKELQEISGVSDATFVHMSGFTGGAKSLEGCLSLAVKSLGVV